MARRRRLTPKQRAEIIARQGGLCALSGEPLAGRKVEFDHERALAMGGEDSLDNLRAVTAEAHLAKTRDDLARLAKAKRCERFMAEGRSRKRKGRPLQSRGFRKAPPQQSARKPLTKWAAWRPVEA